MTNHAVQALQHLEAVTYDADRAQVHALLDIADAIREAKTTTSRCAGDGEYGKWVAESR